MAQHTLFVCVLCRSAKMAQQPSALSMGQALFDRLTEELEACDWRETIRLQPVRCIGACNRSCVVAFAAPAKLTFILSELSPTESVPDLLKFGHQYVTCTGGKVPYQERPETVKKGIHAVLPSLPCED